MTERAFHDPSETQSPASRALLAALVFLLPAMSVVAGSAISVSCSDEDGAGPAGTFDSGFRGNQRILELDAMEALTFCQRRAEFVSDIATIEERRQVRCTKTALLVGTSEMACMESYDACLANPPMFSEDTCVFNNTTDRESCAATVDEIEACLNAMAQKTRREIDDLSCADAGATDVIGAAMALPPECESLRTICQSGVNGGGPSAS